MELSSFKELGIAGIAVGGMATIFYFIVKGLLGNIKELLTEIKTSRQDYSSFVMNNNHKVTEIVEKQVEAMVEVKNQIEINNRATEKHTEILQKLLDKLN